MQHYYAGAIDAVTGKVILPGIARGAETDDLAAKDLAFREQLPEPSNDGPLYWVFGPSFDQAGSAINFMNFDIHRDLDATDDKLTGPLDASSPDLSEFRKHGGKLIMYHGWTDPRIPSQNTIDYFSAVVAHDRDLMSGQAGPTRDQRLCQVVHGSWNVSLRRRAWPQRLRSAGGARHMGRYRRGA